MKQIPYQHCELGSSSALPGWLVIPAKPLGNPLKQLNELLAGPQFHTRPIPLPPTAETPPNCRRSSASRPGPSRLLCSGPRSVLACCVIL